MKLVKNSSTKSKAANSNYNSSKYNAVKYGIFSKHTVMHWENKDDYDNLLKDLIEEYQPNNVTERHLIVEMANTIWAKMRLKYAEKASLQENLYSNISGSSAEYNAKKALLEDKKNLEKFNARKAVLYKETQTENEIKINKEYLKCCLTAKNILEETNIYEDGLAALPLDDRNDWTNEGGLKGCRYGTYHERCDYENTTESLLYWVNLAIKSYENIIYELENRNKVKDHILGGTFLLEKTLDKYMRYENHLDKKFEKTLAMFFKLREIRSNGGLIKSVL